MTAPLVERLAGPEHSILVVAEVGQAHDGSLGTAHAFIDAVARTGAQAIKFQTHLADAESTDREPWRVRFSPQDERRIDYWRRMEFRPEEWRGLCAHAHERGLAFLSSPFSPEAVDLLTSAEVDGLKVASGEVTNTLLLRACRDAELPLLVSSGMSTFAELDAAVDVLRSSSAPMAVLQCNTSYPCPPEEVGLNVLDDLRERYRTEVGLSDHSGTVFPGLAAVALGADVLEVHVTLSRDAFGPDVRASLTVDELALLVDGVRFLSRVRRSPVDKNRLAAEKASLRATFGRTLVARRALAEGHTLTAADIAAKKPAGGLAATAFDQLLGRTLARPIDRDEPIALDDLVSPPGDTVP